MKPMAIVEVLELLGWNNGVKRALTNPVVDTDSGTIGMLGNEQVASGLLGYLAGMHCISKVWLKAGAWLYTDWPSATVNHL